MSKQILDFKDPRSRKHAAALKRFGNEIEVALQTEIPSFQSFNLAIVPSHEAGVTSNAMDWICRVIAGRNENMNYYGNPLARTRTIPKLAHGGSRDIIVQSSTIEIINNRMMPGPYVILDDIITTGNSLTTCKMKLEEVNARVLKALVIGMTVYE